MYNNRNHVVELGDLEIDQELYDLVKDEIAPDTGVEVDHFWNSLAGIVKDLGPRNLALLATRDELQEQIDEWHRHRRGQSHDSIAYRAFLEKIGYLIPEPEDFQISTSGVDEEIGSIAGPQLVVPLDNARFVLNAANARWGSLYDALYGTDVISQSAGCKKIRKYNPIRGEKVIQIARDFLDRHFQLEKDTHHHVVQYRVAGGQLLCRMGDGT
ncbi:MAG: hypothetical protein ACRER2_07540, partial [Methylococcales bacterium]